MSRAGDIEPDRIRLLLDRDGLEGTVDWVRRTLEIYRVSRADPRSPCAHPPYFERTGEVMAVMRRWLAEVGRPAPYVREGGAPPSASHGAERRGSAGDGALRASARSASVMTRHGAPGNGAGAEEADMRQLVPGADLTDRRVQTHGGTVLGRVEDLLVHVTEGRVSHVVVRLERRWGLHRRYYLVPWRRLHVTFGLQAMVFDGDLRDLARAREVDGEPGPEDLVVLPEGPLRRRHEAPMAPG